MLTEMNISSGARQGISWLIFIPRELAEKNKKNNYGGFERLRKCSHYKNNYFKDRDFFREKPLKEKRLVPVTSKSKRLLFPPDINLVTRHYRPEARGNVIYPLREQPAVDTSLYHRLKADKRRTFTLARISQGFQKYTEEITFTYCPSSFTSQISTVTYIGSS